MWNLYVWVPYTYENRLLSTYTHCIRYFLRGNDCFSQLTLPYFTSPKKYRQHMSTICVLQHL